MVADVTPTKTPSAILADDGPFFAEQVREAAFFIRVRGWSPEAAAEVVGIPASFTRYLGDDLPVGGPDYLPSPDEIRAACHDIQAGRLMLAPSPDQGDDAKVFAGLLADLWERPTQRDAPERTERARLPRWFIENRQRSNEAAQRPDDDAGEQ
ncbi:hypothetical protein [Crateriforma spongiae]|uniref:hypothetical protein n=1 Tax=Crateriforma spongiae TaxID=2724528 RepID=UPI0014479F45|nr:hypothetical protein [Crateriforma spongiae]